MAETRTKRIWKPGDQGDIVANRETADVAGVALDWVQLVGNKKNRKTSRLQNAAALLQHSFVATSVLEHFDHRNDIKALRSEGKVLPGRLHAWNRPPERL